MTESPPDRQIQAIERPDRALMTYYLLSALVFPPLFPFVALPLYFRYHTMRYRFTDDGISMSWGVLFRRQVIVNYSRIQDIHLKSNFVERWLGLARILVQTASGSSSAEMTIEGIKEFEAVRDFLYARMRGVKDHPAAPVDAAAGSPASLGAAMSGAAASVNAGPGTLAPAADQAEAAAALREAVEELRAIRALLEERQKTSPRHV